MIYIDLEEANDILAQEHALLIDTYEFEEKIRADEKQKANKAASEHDSENRKKYTEWLREAGYLNAIGEGNECIDISIDKILSEYKEELEYEQKMSSTQAPNDREM